MDNGQTDSIIRTYVDFPLSQNYYVITYPTAAATTSWATQVIQGYNMLVHDNIKQCNEEILFVFNNAGGFKKNYFPQFFKDAFLFTDKDIQQIKYIVNDTLYAAMEGIYSKLTKIFYVHQGSLLFQYTPKWHKINPTLIRHDEFEIQPLAPITIDEDTFRIRRYDELYPYKNGKLLISTDIQDCILELDISKGKIKKSFCSKSLDPADFFCKHIAENDIEKCAFAKKHNISYLNLNRQMIDVLMLQTDTAGNIYCLTTVEAAQINQKDYEGIDDEGNHRIVPKGEPRLSPWYMMLKLDSNFNIKDVY
ncbi:MAG: hypothetical protein H0X63_10395, partial [Flavobacteriales bacterium]|nr:hypothetical protein [Flavobacteriales bacterium]